MTTALAKNPDKMLALLSTGDMKSLSPDERLAYFKARCEHAGLDPLSAPFEWMTLQGKLTLYAKKTATDQLSSLHKLKVTIVSDKVIADAVYVVRARAEAPDGRVKEEDGAVPIKGLDPQALANAVMKASTKAARRAVLAITGLSMLDETEVEAIPGAKTGEPTITAVKNVPATPAHRLVEMVTQDGFVEVHKEPSALDPGIDPPSMNDEPPEEDDEFSPVSAMTARIHACTSLGQLLIVGNDVKRMSESDRAALRGVYAAKQNGLKQSK